MLILRRQVNETICIGEITIMVTAIGNGWVKIGIDAPRDVPVHRGEVQERIDKESEDDRGE